MKKIPYSIKKLSPSLLVMGLISTPLWAVQQQDFATIQGNGRVVYWTIDRNVKYESIKLTLASGDEVIEAVTVAEPSTPSLADGGYNYELVVTPPLGSSVKKELKTLRNSANGQEGKESVASLQRLGTIPNNRQVQSGFFTISGGQLVSADAKE